MNLFITGRSGIGKTTLIKELAQDLGAKAGGFYTEEMRKGKTRVGFRIKALDGKSGILASIYIDTKLRVGKYKVDLEDFERVALPSIENALKKDKIVLIDEIGPMELFSKNFKNIVLEALDSENPVIATIKLKGSKFIDTIKSRKDILIYTLSFDNKREILEKIQIANIIH
jgi:nucleoside-triphosphatase